MLKYFLILTFLFASVSFSQNVSGNVQDLLFNVSLEEVSITVKDNTTGWLVGTDSTDASGNYSIDYIIVGVNENNSIPTDYYLSNPYPQPFNPSTRLEFSTPKQDNFSVRIYNIIGQLVFDKAFTLDAGRHSFNVNDLGSAGIYLFNISSADYTSTQKLVLLDGGSSNVNVELNAAGNTRSNKVSITEFLIEFRKPGYIDKDTVVAWDMNLTVNAHLKQVAGTGTFQFAGHLTRLPTNTNGTNVNVEIKDFALNETLCSTVTDTNGNYNCSIDYAYYINPTNPSQIIYSPSQLKVYLTGQNYTTKDSNFVLNGNNISWNTTIQQTPIAREAHISGVVADSITGLGVNNAFIQLYKVSDNSLLTDTYTDNNGLYSRIFIFSGYEGDPQGVFNNIGDMKYVINKSGYFTKDSVKSFAVINDVNFSLAPQPYIFNATLKLYKTFKGQSVTDLDSIFVLWSDGSIDGYVNNNGSVSINKQLFTLNSDTTAQVFHKHPEQYLKWMVGHRINPTRPDWIFQNENSTTTSTMPLSVVNAEGTVEIYLVPKWANYGPNNDIPMDMESSIVAGFFLRNSAFVSGFRPVISDTVYIFNTTFNHDTGVQNDTTNHQRKTAEILKFTNATHFPQKDLLIYQIVEIDSFQDPLLQWVLNGPRNGDNYTVSGFYIGGPGNSVSIALDGTKRIKSSISEYNIGNSNGVILIEFMDSMMNTLTEGGTYVLDQNLNFSDIAQNIIGISYVFKPGTRYKEPIE